MPATDCLDCGHGWAFHQDATGTWDRCHLIGCSCAKFEGGDAHAERLANRGRSTEETGAGPHVTGPAGATPNAPAGPPDLDCSCGARWISDGQGGFVHTPTDRPAVAGHIPIRGAVVGPPDLDQAIQAATNALDALHTVAGTAGWRWMRPQDVACAAIEAAAPHLRGDLPAAHAELAVLRHSTDQMRDLTREQDQALHTTRQRLADLAAATREYIHHVGHHEIGAGCTCTGHLMDALRGAHPQDTTRDGDPCGWRHWPNDEDADAEEWCILHAGHKGDHEFEATTDGDP